jgi:Fungalysin metallopeptidase (M36)/FG-GAP-like repeat/Fungalysin/Thermolysin Propeptide Motif
MSNKYNQMRSKLRLVFIISSFVLLILPLAVGHLRTKAQTQDSSNSQTKSFDSSLPYYDIRTDKSETAVETLNRFNNQAGKNALEINDSRQNFVVGEESLRNRVPTLITEYNEELRIPEVISPSIKQKIAFLTSPSSNKQSEILRSFIEQNNNLFGISDTQASQLKVTADYTNPDGNLSFAHLEQFINEIPVFRGEVKAGFTKNGEMIRVINNLAPNLVYNKLSSDFGNPADAVLAAERNLNIQTSNSKFQIKNPKSANSDWATTAEKMYFPTEIGVARASWRVLIWQPVNAYYVIIDAETGTVLWRKNITEDQTQAATYNVYANPNSMINTAESPAPGTPGSLDPSLGTQFPIIPRTNVTLIGNEAPYTFNTNGWINNGGIDTDGNTVEAGLDIDGANGVDPTGKAVSPTRNFNFTYSPGNSSGGGDAPTTLDFRNGAVTQLFYTINRYHDEMYRLGFTEAARNFQDNNFGRGGSGGDRVSGEAQDSSGTNNANFGTPADGARGRMQMYVFTPPTPDRDGDLDADVVIHEHTHGLSNRLHGNASGLGSTVSRGMGEGWSDFYAHAMLSEPNDPINGIYTTGAYSTLNFRTAAPFSNLGNYYYGIRRFPKAVMSFTGGPNNRPHNPLTFKDTDAGQLDTSDGAFEAGFPPTTTSVHFLGEVWSSALWEVRAKLIARLGATAGNRKALQLVTDGMKLSPLNPDMIQGRDAILAAARASNIAPEASADVADVWSGFAIRGFGFSATYNSLTSVTEAFDLPNVIQSPNFTFTDSFGNGNGFADPGEALTLNVPITNNSGGSVTNVTLQTGNAVGIYGDMSDSQTVSRNIQYSVSPNQPCGSIVNLAFNISSSRGSYSVTRQLSIGSPNLGLSRNFDNAAILPSGWTSSSTGVGLGWAVSTTSAATLPNALFATDPTSSSSSIIETEPVAISSPASRLRFKINYDTEPNWDGTILEVKIGSGAYTEILAAGGIFTNGAYNTELNTGTFPNAGLRAWSGNSNGFSQVEVTLPALANGQNVQFRWTAGSDGAIGGVGTYIDDLQIVDSFSCNAAIPESRADFDGDGKTDVSVFRPSEGIWYLNRSTAGFGTAVWGLATDILVPADYNGDNKTDFAVFRSIPAQNQTYFYILNSNDFTFRGAAWGSPGDIPVVGDYDGDDKDDVAIWRPTTGDYFILQNQSVRHYRYGLNGDTPVVGDFDGDGKNDFAVFRSSNNFWYLNRSTNGVDTAIAWGMSGDKLVPADYDGDRKDDVAVFRNGIWYINRSTGGTDAIAFGFGTDIPVPGDYDGDGKDDVAVYRNGIWYLNQSTAGFAAITFGNSTDKPIPKQYIP